MQYKVIYDFGSDGAPTEKFINLVNKEMEDGWIPQGGISVARSSRKEIQHFLFNQAMIKIKPTVGQKKCPLCAEMVKLEATKCRYCGHEFDREEVNREIEAKKAQAEAQLKALEKDPAFCSKCKKADSYIDASGKLYCPNCKGYVVR